MKYFPWSCILQLDSWAWQEYESTFIPAVKSTHKVNSSEINYSDQNPKVLLYSQGSPTEAYIQLTPLHPTRPTR
jgi:hypothetical protein